MARNSLSDHRQSDPAPHSATPLSARGSHNYETLVCSSRVMELPNAAEILLTVILEKRQGTESDNTYNCPIFDISDLPLEGAPEPSNGGTPNLEFRVRRVCSINRRPHPLPVIYVYGASTSDYTCCPNIHYLL